MSTNKEEHPEGSSQSSSTRKLVHLPTVDTYDRWAATYDTDGNILQALDTLALQQSMYPLLFDKILTKPGQPAKQSPFSGGEPLHITDLGCGTGRADLMLLSVLRSHENGVTSSLASSGCQDVYLAGVDASLGMLEVANSRVPTNEQVGNNVSLRTQYGSWDIYKPEAEPKWLASESTLAEDMTLAHAVISTLVLEHLEVDIYFQSAKKLLRPGGLFLVTNMHSDMGNMVFGDPEQYKGHPLPTGAGFVDTNTNTKIRASTDYAHTIEEVVKGANKAGFELVDDSIRELAVEPWMLERGSVTTSSNDDSLPLLGARGKKWVGTKCWYGMIFRLQHMCSD